jgi:hypothetical protein
LGENINTLKEIAGSAVDSVRRVNYILKLREEEGEKYISI